MISQRNFIVVINFFLTNWSCKFTHFLLNNFFWFRNLYMNLLISKQIMNKLVWKSNWMKYCSQPLLFFKIMIGRSVQWIPRANQTNARWPKGKQSTRFVWMLIGRVLVWRFLLFLSERHLMDHWFWNTIKIDEYQRRMLF